MTYVIYSIYSHYGISVGSHMRVYVGPQGGLRRAMQAPVCLLRAYMRIVAYMTYVIYSICSYLELLAILLGRRTELAR